MKEYHKIDTIFKRDERGRILLGEYSNPEFEYLADKSWIWTEKIDGTNIRIFQRDGVVHFGGKTDNAQIPTKLLAHLATEFGDPKRLEQFSLLGDNVCLYGEGYGAGIQKGGGNYSLEQKFILFDVWIDGWWLLRPSVEDIAEKLGLDAVPVLFEGTLESACSFVQMPHHSYLNTKATMEGLVGIPKVSLFNRKGERIITKIKARDFERL